MMYHEYNISKDYPDIRLFLVNVKGSETPLTDFVSVGLKWSKPSPRKLLTRSKSPLLIAPYCGKIFGGVFNKCSLFLGGKLFTMKVLVIKT